MITVCLPPCLPQSVIYTNAKSDYIYSEGQSSYKAVLEVVHGKKEKAPWCASQSSPGIEAIVHWMYEEKDSRPGIKVTICPSEISAPPTKASKPRVSACIPALFDKSNSAEKDWTTTWQWSEKFLKYNANLGIDHFFLYTVGPRGSLNTTVPHTWIDVSWVHGVKKKKGMWYYGQYWTVNDCLYRNKMLGTDWILFQDYDEVFVSPKYVTFDKLLDTYKDRKDIDTLMLGSYLGRTESCKDGSTTSSEDWSTCTRVDRKPRFYNSLQNYCVIPWFLRYNPVQVQIFLNAEER